MRLGIVERLYHFVPWAARLHDHIATEVRRLHGLEFRKHDFGGILLVPRHSDFDSLKSTPGKNRTNALEPTKRASAVSVPFCSTSQNHCAEVLVP
jgi:hypothetical protein